MSNRWGLQLTIYDIDNRLRESVAEVLNHPLKDTLNYLPQCLLIGGVLHEYSDAEDVSPEQITRRITEIKQIANGTIIPWSYGGTAKTYFGLHLEDAYMHSANLLLAGMPKVWFFVNQKALGKIQNILAGAYDPDLYRVLRVDLRRRWEQV
jgi:hypothetical protein